MFFIKKLFADAMVKEQLHYLPSASIMNKQDNDQVDLSKWQDGNIKSFSETCFAEYWNDLPQIITSDVSNEDGAINEVDPYKFSHRMALGKYIVENTDGSKIRGKGCTKHWHWGYMAQLDWQLRSGRLSHSPLKAWADAKNNKVDIINSKDIDAIATTSWFGYMNLYFSVACYMGCAAAGLVPPIVLKALRPSSLDFADHEKSVAELNEDKSFKDAIESWKEYWKGVHTQFCNDISKGDSEKHFKTALSTMYRSLWDNHTDLIKYGLGSKRSKTLLTFLPPDERSVALGWSRMVEILSATNWILLSLDSLMHFGCGYLPSCQLGDDISDVFTDVKPMSVLKWLEINKPKEFKTSESLIQLCSMSDSALASVCGFWARVAWWDFERQKLPKTLDILTNGSVIKKLPILIRIIVLASLPHSLTEACGWIAILAAILLMV